mgnify:CR=1 FL=1
MMDKKVKVKPRRGVKILFFLIILFVLLFLYARYINTSGFIVKEVAIIDEEMDANYNGFKIVHFSDLHYGRTTFEEDLNKIVEEINKLEPDVIVFTGDLFDTDSVSDEDVRLVTRYLEKLEARLFKFAIIGDYDKRYLEAYQTILNDSHFLLLDNTSKLVYDNSAVPINFVGLTNTKDIDTLYENNYFTITLVHEPDSIHNIQSSNIVLAGHSLGGQIKIPFIGGIIKKDGASTYINDYYEVNQMKLYISNGIGTQDFSFRLFNKPSITLYRLYNY